MDHETERKIKEIQTKYRKAVRREYFRRQGALKRLLRMAGAGDLGPALKPVQDVARSSGVALPPLPEANGRPYPASPSAMPPGVEQPDFGRKAMPERDDENKGQTDHLSSSSGADMTDGHRQVPWAINQGQQRQLRIRYRE